MEGDTQMKRNTLRKGRWKVKNGGIYKKEEEREDKKEN